MGGECATTVMGKSANVVAPAKEGNGGYIPANGRTPVVNRAGFAAFRWKAGAALAVSETTDVRTSMPITGLRAGGSGRIETFLPCADGDCSISMPSASKYEGSLAGY